MHVLYECTNPVFNDYQWGIWVGVCGVLFLKNQGFVKFVFSEMVYNFLNGVIENVCCD